MRHQESGKLLVFDWVLVVASPGPWTLGFRGFGQTRVLLFPPSTHLRRAAVLRFPLNSASIPSLTVRLLWDGIRKEMPRPQKSI